MTDDTARADLEAEDSEHTDDWLDGYEAGWSDAVKSPARPSGLLREGRLYRVWDRVAALRLTGDWPTRKKQVLAIIEEERAALDATEPGLDVERLIEDGRKWQAAEAEGHVVTFTETGYGLMHPPSCRPDLIGCWFNAYLADMSQPDEEPGRYRMTRHKAHAEYARLREDVS